MASISTPSSSSVKVCPGASQRPLRSVFGVNNLGVVRQLNFFDSDSGEYPSGIMDGCKTPPSLSRHELHWAPAKPHSTIPRSDLGLLRRRLTPEFDAR